MSDWWHIIEVSVNFIQNLVIFKAFELYYDKRFRFKYSVEAAILVMTTVLSLLNYFVSIESNPLIYLGYILLIYVFAIFIFKGNIFSKAFTTFSILAIIGTCEFIAALFISIVSGIEINSLLKQDFGRFEAMIIAQLLLLYMYLFMRKSIDKEKMNLLTNKYYLLVGSILFLTVSIIIIVVWLYGNINNITESINNNLVLLTICVSLLSVVSIYLTNKIINEINEKHKNDMELQHMKMEQAYFTDVNSALEEIRILRHDMRGELAIIHGYNELNQRDNIRNHIEKKLQQMDVQLLPQMDKDNIITSFLNFKLKEAKAKNITIHFKSSLIQENEISIDKEEICRILNNIINNAIEACMECHEKYIKLSIEIIGKCIIIKSENPFKGEIKRKGSKILTIKKDKARHGYGIKSIQSIAEKYGGYVDINYDNNVFSIVVQVLINFKQKEASEN